MDLADYRAARRHHLVEVATGLGVPAERAGEVVDRVIEDQRRRILRAADPDEVVVPALRDEVLGRPSRGPTLAIAALVVVVAGAFAVPLLAAGPDKEEDGRKGVAVPSLVGLTSEEAVVALKSIGIASRIDPVPQCDPAGQVLGSVPPAGGAVRPDQVVTVVATATPTWTCPGDAADRTEAWAFLRFLVSGTGRPHLAREVRLYVDGQPAGTADGRQAATGPDWRWRVRDPVVASVVRPVANDLGQPVVSITRGPLPPVTCAVPTPRPSGVVPDATRVVLTADADPRDGGQGDVCQLTIDLFEDADGTISVVSVVIPGERASDRLRGCGPATTSTSSTAAATVEARLADSEHDDSL